MFRRAQAVLLRSGALQGAAPLAVFLVALALAWPEAQTPRISSDTHQYMSWLPGRLLTYCGFLNLFGATPLLCHVQTALSIFAWCFFGHTLGRLPGLLAAAAMAVSFQVSQWNLVALSESVFMSLLVLLLAWSLRLWREWSWPRLLAWCACALLLLVCRPTAMYLIPFLVLPFAFRPRRQALWTGACAMLVLLPAHAYIMSTSETLQRHNLVHVIGRRVLPDPEATAFFRAAGMPYTQAVRDYAGRAGGAYQKLLWINAPELVEWVMPRGKQIYTRWLLTRRASYPETWQALAANLNDTRLTQGTFGRNVRPSAGATALMPFYRLVGKIPPLLWVLGALLPLVEWLRRRRPTAAALFGTALIPATLAQAFICFHADTFEIERHLWPSTVLYRIGILFLLSAGGQVLLRRRTAAAAGAQAPAAPRHVPAIRVNPGV